MFNAIKRAVIVLIGLILQIGFAVVIRLYFYENIGIITLFYSIFSILIVLQILKDSVRLSNDLPWIILILGLILIPKNNININPYICLSLIFIIGFLVRINQYDAYGLWWDELYVAMQTLDGFGIYFDATNPPIFPLLAKIQTALFPEFDYSKRLLTIFCGSFAMLSLFFLIKTYVNKYAAILSSFILSISIYAIAYSQEYRSYSVLMLLSPLVVYSFLKMLREKSNISYVIYGILGAIFINTHLYASIFLLGNGFFGNSSKKKRKKYFKIYLCKFVYYYNFFTVYFS